MLPGLTKIGLLSAVVFRLSVLQAPPAPLFLVRSHGSVSTKIPAIDKKKAIDLIDVDVSKDKTAY